MQINPAPPVWVEPVYRLFLNKSNFVGVGFQFRHDFVPDFDPLQGFHKRNQILNFVVRALQLRQNIAVFKVLTKTGQPQPASQFGYFQTETDFLHAAGKNDAVSAQAVRGKLRKLRSPRLIYHVRVPSLFETIFETQERRLHHVTIIWLKFNIVCAFFQ